MKSNLVIILSHSNTDQKRSVLQETIRQIKEHQFDVLLVSHLPEPIEIQQMVDYFIYDKSNPLINYPDRGMVYWQQMRSNDQTVKLQNIMPDYGWTAINQILNSSRLVLPLDYTHYSFINYDIVLTDAIIKNLKEPVDLLTSKVKDELNPKGFRYPNFMFNILSKDILSRVLPLVNKREYMNDMHSAIEGGKFIDAEHYWAHLISVFDREIFDDHLIEDKIDFIFPDIFNFADKGTPFKVFFQNNNTFEEIITNSWTPRLMVYNNINHDKVILSIDDWEEIITTKTFIMDLPDKIESIGYWYNSEYIDLTDKYKNANFATINYV